MSITMPQAIMLNHAAWVSRQNSDKRSDAKKEKEERKKNGIISAPHEIAEADYVNNLSPEQLSDYMSKGWE